MIEKLEVKEILDNIMFLDNVGKKLTIINPNWKYIYMKDLSEIDDNIDSDLWTNIDIYFFNKVLDAIPHNEKTKTVMELNHVVDIVNSLYKSYENKFRLIASEKKFSLEVSQYFKEVLIRYIQESHVNKLYDEKLNFFETLFNIYKSGHIVCGWSGDISVTDYNPLEPDFDNIDGNIEGYLIVC